MELGFSKAVANPVKGCSMLSDKNLESLGFIYLLWKDILLFSKVLQCHYADSWLPLFQITVICHLRNHSAPHRPA